MPTFNIEAPFALRTSHNIVEHGFKGESKFEITNAVDAKNIDVLGVIWEEIKIVPTPNGGLLKGVSSGFQDENEVLNFLVRFESAVSSHFGLTQGNPHYGGVFIEIDLYALQITPSASSSSGGGAAAMHVSDSLAIEISTSLSLAQADLDKLRFNAIVDLFFAGSRASTPEAKFLNWFIIIEEFVENNMPLNKNFELLFSEIERAEIKNFGAKYPKKWGRVAGVFETRTEKSRHEKLSEILHAIGVTEVKSVLGGGF
ncbi:MAG: hypothetical protein GC184_13635 [Rhizobiales bacterium]|nr:hypothetical protein [Hyphomicrobiales bacterium]